MMNRLPFGMSVQQDALPKLAMEVSAANTEVIDIAETLARQARETSDPELRIRLLEAASRLVEVNRKVNTSVEAAIGSNR